MKYTDEDFERYASGHLNRLYVIPIIEDHSSEVVYFGSQENPVAPLGPPPDRVVGYRFYIVQDGNKRIMEVRASDTSDYNLFRVFYRDWDEADVLRSYIDRSDVLS